MDSPEHISIALFPFEDLSLKNDLNIFCRSFTSDLATELARFTQFQVILHSDKLVPAEPEQVKESGPSGSDYFIQGTFRGDKEMVRVNVQLYDGQTLHLVWGNRLEGKWNDMALLQENLLTGVVGVLQQQINHDLLARIKKRPKVQFRAYEHWLYGMEELRKGTPANDLRAREHFSKALEIQPNYSLGYSGMSMTYFNEWSCQLWDRWEMASSEAYKWAQKAIELDDQDYIAAMVLGKIFLFEGSYSTAEYYLRKSLQLNPNDPDTLVLISSYLCLLGYGEEAVEIFERTLRLYPVTKNSYFTAGTFIFFEMGDFEKAASYVVHAEDSKWADSDAYNAAVYYYLGDHTRMREHWRMFLENFHTIVKHGRDYTTEEVIDWLIKINPHKNQSRLLPFLKFISEGAFSPREREAAKPAPALISENHFLKEGDNWKLSFEGETILLPEVKGYFDIARLLSCPRQPFHCAELMGSLVHEKGERLVDNKAKSRYQKKIMELQADIREAEDQGNHSLSLKLQEEYETLIDHLSKILGLRGKVRESGSPVEKARSAVTWRIRHAIARIEAKHQLLGIHLSNSIKTGTLCSYQPEKDINWIIA